MTVEYEGVSAVVYNPDTEKFLVLKRAKDKEFYPGKWEFPGGKAEDEDPENAILREFEEETDLVGVVVKRGDVFEWRSKYGTARTSPFLIEVDEADVELSREHVDYRWVTREELFKLDTYTGSRKALEALGIKIISMRVPEDADRDFTASAFIVRDNKLLLMKHSKLGMWLQPGGHIEEGETPDEAARREAREETGVEVKFVEDFVPEGSLDETDNLPRPFNINLHPIRDDHYHCDFQFLATVKEENEATHADEHDGLKWFSREELQDESCGMPENLREAGERALEYLD